MKFVFKLVIVCYVFSGNILFADDYVNGYVDEYIDKEKCDQIIDKQLYQICYSYKYKGALSGWVKLDGNLVGKGDIKKRPRFYNEKT